MYIIVIFTYLCSALMPILPVCLFLSPFLLELCVTLRAKKKRSQIPRMCAHTWLIRLILILTSERTDAAFF